MLAALLGGADAGARFIVTELRLPRVLCALLTGLALGVSGAIFQTLTRNPLGSPDVIGFQSGTVTGALVVITVLGGAGLQASAGALVGGSAPPWPSTCSRAATAGCRATGSCSSASRSAR